MMRLAFTKTAPTTGPNPPPAPQAEIRRFYARYLEAFHTGNAAAVAPFYRVPCLFSATQGVALLETDAEIAHLSATYTLRKTDDGWQTVTVVAHGPTPWSGSVTSLADGIPTGGCTMAGCNVDHARVLLRA